MPRVAGIQGVVLLVLVLGVVRAASVAREDSSPELVEISATKKTNESESVVGDSSIKWRSRRSLAYRKRRNLGTNRISDECTKSDISIFQGRSSPLPNGIPTYSVQIINLCVVGCPLSNIHIGCGWFASAKLVNPKIFKRVGYNDCLVNDGKPIAGGESIFFHYANSFQYPLRVESAVSCSSGS